jgi:hypothetical protein
MPPGGRPGRLVRSSGRAFIRWRRWCFRFRASCVMREREIQAAGDVHGQYLANKHLPWAPLPSKTQGKHHPYLRN